MITDKLQTQLPPSVPYLNYKDLEPVQVETEEMKQKKHEKF